jgi:hypothetical protein
LSGLRGDVSKLRTLERAIRELPRVVGAKVAAAAAGKISELARSTFDAGENAYGDTWEPGADGRKVTLRKSGATAAGVRYVAIGTRLRAQLGPRYAKYQVGRRPIFPRSKLPTKYVEGIGQVATVIIRGELGR